MLRSALFLTTLAGVASASPVVQRQSVRIEATTFHAKDYVPKIDFAIVGDPADKITVAFSKPDGTPWGVAEPRVDAGDDRHVHQVANGMPDPDHLSATYVGVIKFKILDGASLLMAGSFKVDQIAPGTFAVDNAWRTAGGQIWFDSDQHADNPSVQLAAWFQGYDGNCSDLKATLAYNGRVDCESTVATACLSWRANEYVLLPECRAACSMSTYAVGKPSQCTCSA